MSTPNGPSRRRRIAGESKPGAPAPPTRPVVRTPQPSAPEPTPADDTESIDETAGVDATTEVDGTTAAPEDEAPAAIAPATTAPARPAAPRVGGRRPDVEPDLAATPAAEPATRTRPSVGRLLLVLLAVAAVAFGGFFGYRGLQEARDVETAHAEAAETAASSAETIFSYRYDRIEQYLEDSREVMTDSFADDFETISPALSDLAPQRQIQVKATTRDAAAEPCGDDCSRDEATVLVFVDQARLADGSTTPTVFGNRVEMTMVHRDGRWLVDDVKAL